MTRRAIFGGYDSRTGTISLEVGALPEETVRKWRDEKILVVDIDLPGKKRSLNSNSYFHILVSKIAEALGTSNTEVKNKLIRDYGQYEIIDGKRPLYRVKDDFADIMLLREDIHFKIEGREGDMVLLSVMRGSHTYNTREMKKLIDGTVEEAKTLGIETLTPRELEEMLKKWDVTVERREQREKESSPLF